MDQPEGCRKQVEIFFVNAEDASLFALGDG